MTCAVSAPWLTLVTSHSQPLPAPAQPSLTKDRAASARPHWALCTRHQQQYSDPITQYWPLPAMKCPAGPFQCEATSSPAMVSQLHEKLYIYPWDLLKNTKHSGQRSKSDITMGILCLCAPSYSAHNLPNNNVVEITGQKGIFILAFPPLKMFISSVFLRKEKTEHWFERLEHKSTHHLRCVVKG